MMNIFNLISLLPLVLSVLWGILSYLECIHFVYEGHIGLYTLGGALLTTVNEPGIHLKAPFITQFHHVQVTLQTDQVVDINCGTSSGVIIIFGKIEVVNRLKKELAWQTIKNYTIHYDKTWIFDKIHHEINQFCSSHTLQDVLIDKFDILDDALRNALQKGCDEHAPGIEIIAVRVTKPRIPANIAANYENREMEKTKFLIAKQEQLVQEKVSETKKMTEIIQAEVKTEISKINMTKEIIRKEGSRRIQEIENKIKFDHAGNQAKIVDHRTRQQNEINKLKLTAQYINEQAIQSIKATPKVYFGRSIPQYFKENLDILNLSILKQEQDVPIQTPQEQHQLQQDQTPQGHQSQQGKPNQCSEGQIDCVK